MTFYRAYKGQCDLPLDISLDSVFVGHRGQDTLLYARALRLSAVAKTSGYRFEDAALLAVPIALNELRLEQATFHSDSLIAAVGIDVHIGLLDVRSPAIIIAEGQYPLHGLQLYDSYVGIDLRATLPDTTSQDTTPMKMAFDVPDGDIRNLHFALTPMEMHVHTQSLWICNRNVPRSTHCLRTQLKIENCEKIHHHYLSSAGGYALGGSGTSSGFDGYRHHCRQNKETQA